MPKSQISISLSSKKNGRLRRAVRLVREKIRLGLELNDLDKATLEHATDLKIKV